MNEQERERESALRDGQPLNPSTELQLVPEGNEQSDAGVSCLQTDRMDRHR